MTEKETRLVEENVPLAVYTAGQWMKKAVLEWEDALSAAEYGLVKAAMSFEEERGFCFSTYAVSVMENEIRMELRKRNRRKKVVYFGDPVSGAEGLTLGDTIADTRDHFGMSETVHDLIRSRDLTEKERDTAKRVKRDADDIPYCPYCESPNVYYYEENMEYDFCPDCGQRLKWEE